MAVLPLQARNPQAQHPLDTRCMLVLVFAASIALFNLSSWVQLALFSGITLMLFVALRLSWSRSLKYCIPLSPFIVLSLLGNSFALSFSSDPVIPDAVSPVVAYVSLIPIHLAGPLYFLPYGCALGAYASLRILLLLWVSILFVLSTTGNEIISAAFALTKPLRKLKVPVDDFICIFAVALRFIPLIGLDALRIYRAQKARTAHFDEGGFFVRLKAWSWVLVPLFMSLFRHAETLSEALDARAYGANPERGSLYTHTLDSRSIVFTLGLLLLLLFIVVLPALFAVI